MKPLYFIALGLIVLATNCFAQDPSVDRWVDSGDATVVDIPATGSGRITVSKGFSNATTFNELLRIRVNHSANDYISFRNATGTNSFVPSIFSYNESGNGSSFMLLGVTNYSNDFGNDALINFNARKYFDNSLTSGGAPIVGRPLFSWNNYTTVYMQMLANGNLGLGTTFPQAQLHTTGSVRFSGLPGTTSAALSVVVTDENGTLSRYNIPFNSALATISSSTTNALPKFGNSGTLSGSQITDNGTGVGVGGAPTAGAKLTLYGTISLMSDERQKTNIVRLDHALDKVSALNGYYYNWREGSDTKQVGFMAQEVERVLPEVVSQNSEGTRFVNYDGLVPLLTEAIKEQRAMLEVQSQLIKELQREVSSLTRKK
ncbi:tail fiber domain-containing protein [uncultured Fibrella sp.]|uniref:tail fiber domain-containing protein n=1 Tax=uncultured Fibrella sp. TaxID=1284596 RepID=UPI0035CB4AC7